jgi:Flp pilus assembly protein TadD
MKKLTFLVVMLAFLANVSMAQNKERVNAFNYNKNAQGYITTAEQLNKQNRAEKAAKQMGFAKIELQKAKTSIDLAAEHEETKNEARTWHYYGIVYYKIAAYPEFHDLDPEALDKSFAAFAKIPALDPEYANDRQNMFDIYQHIQSITSNYFNRGAVAYENGEYAEAIKCYLAAYNSMLVIGQQDNEALLIAAQIALYNAKEYEKTVEICNQLLAAQHESPKVYQYLAVAYSQMGNDEEMLKYINEGRAKFPEDDNLVNEQINAYLKLKREAEIIDQIKEMANKNNENSVYCLIIGTIYSNQESELYNVDSALVYYNRAIEVNPTDENAYINVGSMYIDKSAALINKANELPLDKFKEYDELIAEARVFDEKALPYVEKAYELVPGDDAIKQALRTLYVRLKMMDKARALESAE